MNLSHKLCFQYENTSKHSYYYFIYYFCIFWFMKHNMGVFNSQFDNYASTPDVIVICSLTFFIHKRLLVFSSATSVNKEYENSTHITTLEHTICTVKYYLKFFSSVNRKKKQQKMMNLFSITSRFTPSSCPDDNGSSLSISSINESLEAVFNSLTSSHLSSISDQSDNQLLIKFTLEWNIYDLRHNTSKSTRNEICHLKSLTQCDKLEKERDKSNFRIQMEKVIWKSLKDTFLVPTWKTNFPFQNVPKQMWIVQFENRGTKSHYIKLSTDQLLFILKLLSFNFQMWTSPRPCYGWL